PSGNSGVLVTTLEGFRDYQLNQAQTWEHQALCRARAVAGTKSMQSKVMSVIQEVISLPRDIQLLAHDVRSMRQKMIHHLASKDSTVINLKQDHGGLIDIEFLAQYARLRFGHDANATVMILQSIPCGAPYIWRKEAAKLADIYLQYRQMENILRVELWASIGSLPMNQDATEWESMRRHTRITSPNILLESMQYVHNCFNTLLLAS
ncbi:MAG: bifunctional [glutamate--ammonia ligase]-adenylyl-L-tyrosine phosphorylase/[glutamate--ammonia-ligase] adenylyltransferase, partial [Mariprofundaceae bacterium]|nr:bifunctional [glutamate--ammonia ligase]-adenylyl-L-tyrosine phosphorylase/[glutamate--ammonia-ligase] adenylyltransferase [Mariprofundaceae bacterium]